MSTLPIPKHCYGFSAKDSQPECTASVMRIHGHDRDGWLARSVHDRITFPEHTVSLPQGSLTVWIASKDDLCSWTAPGDVSHHEPEFQFFPLLITAPETPLTPVRDAFGALRPGPLRREWESAPFAFLWSATWYPQLFAKFHPGSLYINRPPHGTMYRFSHNQPRERAIVAAGHFPFRRETWYQLALTWDHIAGHYRLYANGVLLTAENRFAGTGFDYQLCARPLQAGSTTFAFGEVKFYDCVLDPTELAASYHAEATRPDPDIQCSLERTYAGTPVLPFEFEPDGDWTLRLENDLRGAQAADLFIQQGLCEAVQTGPEGLHVSTHRVKQTSAEGLDRTQGYLWTRASYEGDLYLDFEFMPLQPNGLALLCLRATGMQGEDFMRDHPLRSDGSMRMVYGENVRLYHWEYWREMDDTRNDVATHALIKAPFVHPMAYHCQPAPLTHHRWHRVQFLQIGNRLRGAVDGQLVFDVEDDGQSGLGPVYRDGRIGFRSMVKTDLRYRNLRIWTRANDWAWFGQAL